ncbi:MAG: hypothetical protein RBS73_13085 [Prolixibacteraceae bacterium]|jgi:hypothetical protein|nr:hypothetical protein [Prolixibacteraceae bacterium]
MAGINIRLLIETLFIPVMFSLITSCNSHRGQDTKDSLSMQLQDSIDENEFTNEFLPVNALLVSPRNPRPGEPFRILATGGKNIRKAKILVNGPAGGPELLKSRTGGEAPSWRIDDFAGDSAGRYTVSLIENKRKAVTLEFVISPEGTTPQRTGAVWKTLRGWDSDTEALYSVWINILFHKFDERDSWSSLNEITQDRENNFLYNYLSLGEDAPESKIHITMQPDCADNPFFLRAYFAWKLGLPFGYHVCDRGYLGHNPGTGQWVTNETPGIKSHPVLAFNSFLRRVMNEVHSGTARTALNNPDSDYYPVSLARENLRPGTVFADPYGHTFVLVNWIPQKNDRPGMLLSVDAQPDGTVGIKRFWKGNFMFNTSEVVGEPGFKVFRPILFQEGTLRTLKNDELTKSSGFIPFSMQQNKMERDTFYRKMERLINPKPLGPETALLDLIRALHGQLTVRVASVANGEAYFMTHPGTVIPMPSNAAGVFLTGGQWEAFSTPNRDLRLLIAMDAVLDFPDRMIRSPEDFSISSFTSPEQVKKKLETMLDAKTSELSITYTRTDGSLQKLTIKEILARRTAFEMAYNPNDGAEIRWGAPENSDERSTCRRHAPSYQLERMRAIRKWFTNRLHPPT